MKRYTNKIMPPCRRYNFCVTLDLFHGRYRYRVVSDFAIPPLLYPRLVMCFKFNYFKFFKCFMCTGTVK